jgi:hypothetical protein
MVGLMKSFEPPVTADLAGGSWLLDKMLGLVRETFESIAFAVTNSAIIRIDLDVTPTNVFHGLGESPRAYDIVGRDAGEHVFEASGANPNRARFVTLQATGPVSVAIRFS